MYTYRKINVCRQNLCIVMSPKRAQKVGLKNDHTKLSYIHLKNAIKTLQVQVKILNKLLKGILTMNLMQSNWCTL